MASFDKLTLSLFDQEVPLADTLDVNQPPTYVTSATQTESTQKRGRKSGGSNELQRLAKIMKIILRLAANRGYDYNGRIRRNDGQYITHSDVLQLIGHSMRVGRVIVGEKEFVELLYEAQVDPNLIINDNV